MSIANLFKVLCVLTLVMSLCVLTSCDKFAQDKSNTVNIDNESNVTDGNVDNDQNDDMGDDDVTIHTHSFGDWYGNTATCTEGGEERRECTTDGCEHYETRATEALGHDEISHEAKEPTYTEVGWDAYVSCSRCDYSTKVEKPVLKLFSEGLAYSSVLGGCQVVGRGTCTDTDIIVPEVSPDGLTVLEVWENAFSNDKSIKSVTLPATVKTIHARAFSGCSELERINIPDAVELIGLEAFAGCTSLKDIEIPLSVKVLGKNVFLGCEGLSYNEYENGIYLESAGNAYAVFLNPIDTAVASFKIHKDTVVVAYGSLKECTSLEALTVPSIDCVRGAVNISPLFGNFFGTLDTWEHEAVIPATLKTLTITGGASIPARYFSGCKNLVSINLPDTLTEIGEYAFSECKGLTSIQIPTGVTVIPRYAFNHCQALESVTMPDGATEIGEAAFVGCLSLKNVDIPDSIEIIGENAFKNCSSITEIDVPATLVSMGKYAFDGCTSLESMTLPFLGSAIDNTNNAYLGYVFNGYDNNGNPESLKAVAVRGGRYLSWGAFSECRYIESIVLPESLVGLSGSTFKDCVSLVNIIIPAGVATKGTGEYEFAGCTSLVSVVIPEGITSIKAYTFSGCTSLKGVSLPSSIKYIEQYAFSYCTALESFAVPEKVNMISEYAFTGCTSLVSVELGNVGRIDSFAFQNCTSLVSIYLPASIYEINNGVFSGCRSLESIEVASSNYYYRSVDGNLYKDTYLVRYAPAKTATSFVIPADVTYIEQGAFDSCAYLEQISFAIGTGMKNLSYGAFENCTSLKSIVIPETVTTIESAFRNCVNLTGVQLPAGLKGIGDNAFEGCTALVSIVIPEGVMYINKYAFSGCTSLTSVTLGSKVATINKYAFYNCASLVSLEIPSSIVDVYENAFEGCESLEFNEYDNGCYLGNSENPYVVFIKPTSGDITELVIHGNTKAIMKASIAVCKSLEKITVPFIGCGNPDDSFASIFGNSSKVPSSLKTVVVTGGTTVCDNAFQGCSNITSITLPSTLTQIGSYAFSGCNGLTEIKIPASVTSIGAYAFQNCKNLTSVTFEAGSVLTSIGNSAFNSCKALQSIEIPASVSEIGNTAFFLCSKLTDVYYGGSETEWAAIAIGSSNDALTNATIHFTEE